MNRPANFFNSNMNSSIHLNTVGANHASVMCDVPQANCKKLLSLFPHYKNGFMLKFLEWTLKIRNVPIFPGIECVSINLAFIHSWKARLSKMSAKLLNSRFIARK
jgi:hypothetical protein